jgi:stage II sporulation protein M
MKKRVKKGKTKKTNFFRENYSKSWNYLKEAGIFIWIIVLLFFVFVLIGFVVPIPENLKNIILDYVRQILEKTSDMSFFELIVFIFFNNLKSAFLGMIFGIFIGVFPVIVTLANGYLLGYISSLAVKEGGAISLLSLLPHGIFELPAIFIALGLGLKLGTVLFQKKLDKSFNEFFINSIRIFVFIVLPLLMIAAIIEGSLIFLRS